ncbi:hypothetical protein EMPG_11241 [Blastomyces silverae]|uniref:Uncharacterized protein n=1 Tax=Blastomyces silverae TaxID=2060906 RepID=A0A0H1BS56_9EURO|nr:hypothetical protein EMPG_11241 [Blastomyces silverae]
MITLNTEKNNQVASLQQKIKYLHRETAASTLEVSSQSHTASSEIYTLTETVLHNENLHRDYIKSSNLSEPSSFSSNQKNNDIIN